jgi:septal ring factor EnvC (AmiA/AmiB activator)
MTETLKPQDNKFLSYLSMGVNTLVIAHLLYVGQLVNSTSSTVIRFEENIKTLSRQYDAIEAKLDNYLAKSQQIDKQVAQLETRIERLESIKKP